MVDDGINTSNNNNNNNNPEGEDREINLYAVFFKYNEIIKQAIN